MTASYHEPRKQFTKTCSHKEAYRKIGQGRPVLVGLLAIVYLPLLIGFRAAQRATAGLSKSAMHHLLCTILSAHDV